MNALSESFPLMPEFTVRSAGLAIRPSDFQLDPLALESWDVQVATHPGVTVFHSAAWARVLHETDRHTPCYLGRIEAGGGSDLLPIVEVASVVTGKRGVELPFLRALGGGTLSSLFLRYDVGSQPGNPCLA